MNLKIHDTTDVGTVRMNGGDILYIEHVVLNSFLVQLSWCNLYKFRLCSV